MEPGVGRRARGRSHDRRRAKRTGSARREATALLSQYLRINTTNPRGNEIAAAPVAAEVLRRDGIEARIFEPAREG